MYDDIYLSINGADIAAICIQELSPTTIATGASPKKMIKKEKRSQNPPKIHLTKPQPPIITRLRQSRRPRGMLIREIEQQVIILTRSRSRISPRRWRPIDPPHRRRRPLGREWRVMAEGFLLKEVDRKRYLIMVGWWWRNQFLEIRWEGINFWMKSPANESNSSILQRIHQTVCYYQCSNFIDLFNFHQQFVNIWNYSFYIYIYILCNSCECEKRYNSFC